MNSIHFRALSSINVHNEDSELVRKLLRQDGEATIDKQSGFLVRNTFAEDYSCELCSKVIHPYSGILDDTLYLSNIYVLNHKVICFACHRLKMPSRSTPSQSKISEQFKFFQIDDIIGRRSWRDRIHYLVKWKGPSYRATWIPTANIPRRYIDKYVINNNTMKNIKVKMIKEEHAINAIVLLKIPSKN
jgi:hypothetical protein